MIGPQVISKGTMDSLEEASAYFKKVLQEHLDNKRDITLFAIAVVGGRLKVVEVYQNDQTRRHNYQCIHPTGWKR